MIMNDKCEYLHLSSTREGANFFLGQSWFCSEPLCWFIISNLEQTSQYYLWNPACEKIEVIFPVLDLSETPY